MIGLCQAVAMIPGVSRSAATIIGGLILGIKRKTIVEFSFLLSVPTMVAATGFDLIKSGSHFSWEEFNLLHDGIYHVFYRCSPEHQMADPFHKKPHLHLFWNLPNSDIPFILVCDFVSSSPENMGS